MEKLNVESWLVAIESVISAGIILYFSGKIDCHPLLELAILFAVQVPIFTAWGIVHIIVKHLIK